jgi:hypothetical protein
MPRYLFYNVYGDADELVASAPEDVICVPFGWSAEAEAFRNNLLNELNVTVSALPALVYWKEAQEVETIDGPVVIEAHWKELRIAELEKPWSWDALP